MTDTYKTSYAVPKLSSIQIDGVDTDIAGYVNTCDSCKTCHDSETGTSSDGVWLNGETTINFRPHLNFSTEKHQIVGGSRQLKTSRGAPSWEEAGGFYFKRRSSKIKISPEAPAGEVDGVCMYLIECNYSVECSSQILNFFRGGADRMLFLNLQRNTDEAFCNQAWPDNTTGGDTKKYQYFYFWRGIGNDSSDVFSGNKLPLSTTSGTFYFLAKAHDVISLEWFEHATRSLNGFGGTSRYLGGPDENTKRVNIGENDGGNIIEHGPGQCHAFNSLAYKQDSDGKMGFGHDYDILAFMSLSASRWSKRARQDRQQVSQSEKNSFSLSQNGDTNTAKFFTAVGGQENSSPSFTNYFSTTYDQKNYSKSQYSTNFWLPPSYGWHSLHDLSLGGVDAPNQDWELAKIKQEGKSDAQLADWGALGVGDLCSASITLKKKLIVIPQLAVNEVGELQDNNQSSYAPFVSVPLTADGSKQRISTENHFDGAGSKLSLSQRGRAQETLLGTNQGNFNAKLGKNIQVGGRVGGVFANNEGFTKANSTIIPNNSLEGN